MSSSSSSSASSLVLEGTHVRLEPLAHDHLDALLKAASEDRTTFVYTSVPEDEPTMRRYIARALDERAAGVSVPFATIDRSTGTVVGTTRFMDIDYWPDAAPGVPSIVEIGSTWLTRSVQRTPINTEAKLLMLRHAFDVWSVHRVSLKTDVRNERSRRAIERIGGVLEGVRRADKPATDGGVRDSACYSIVAAEWPAARDALRARLR